MAIYNPLRSLGIKHRVRLLGELKALQDLVNSGIKPKTGICGHVSYSLYREFETWPHYSGNLAFPIPGDYKMAYFADTLWADSEYGNLRRDLLNHCINEVQTELANYHALMLGLQEVHKAPTPYGICVQSALADVSNRLRNLKRLFVGWPLYSGCIDFPVPEDAGYDKVGDQYFKCDRWSGDYGERRRDLLVYCIDTLRTGLGSYRP